MNEQVATPFRQILASILRPVPPPLPAPKPTQHYRYADVKAYRRIEADVYQQLSAELTEAGQPVDPGTLAWVVDEALERLAKRVGR